MIYSQRFLSIIFTFLLVNSLPISAQKKIPDIDCLSKYDRITDVYLSEHMLKESQLSFGDIEDMPESFSLLMRSVSSIRIFVAEDPKEISVLQSVFAPIKSCSLKGTELIMSIKKKGNRVNFVGLMDGNKSHGLYLLVDNPGNSTAIIFGGDFTRKQIEALMPQNTSQHSRIDKKKGRP